MECDLFGTAKLNLLNTQDSPTDVVSKCEYFLRFTRYDDITSCSLVYYSALKKGSNIFGIVPFFSVFTLNKDRSYALLDESLGKKI